MAEHRARDAIWVGDAREMDRFGQVADDSVALVVTSPPYFAGKEYEAVLGVGHVPADYDAYLGMLHDVFAQCFDKLEPGGRMAVNVANLGRKPYRSLSRDVIDLLERPGLSAPGGDHLAEEPCRRGLVRLGHVPTARQPRAPRRLGADHRGLQGALRPGHDRRTSGPASACRATGR